MLNDPMAKMLDDEELSFNWNMQHAILQVRKYAMVQVLVMMLLF